MRAEWDRGGPIVRGCGMGRETGLVGYRVSFLAEPQNDTAVGGGPRGWADVTDWQYGVLPPRILREPPASADLRQHERPSPKATTRDCHYGGGDGFRLGGRNDGRKSGRDDGGAGITRGWGCRVTTRGWHCGVTLRSTLRYAKGALSARFPFGGILHRRMFHLRHGERPLLGMDSCSAKGGLSALRTFGPCRGTGMTEGRVG